MDTNGRCGVIGAHHTRHLCLTYEGGGSIPSISAIKKLRQTVEYKPKQGVFPKGVSERFQLFNDFKSLSNM